jgi:hypothetical protein
MLLTQVFILSGGTSGLRNSKLLVDAGNNIINGNSPYTTPNPYGSWPGLFFFLIDKIAIFGMTSILINLLNLAGYLFMIKFIFDQISSKSLLIIGVVSAFTSPLRALFSNVQNTGLVIGASLLGLYFYQISKKRREFLFTLLSSFCFLFALELKPQVVLPFIVIFIVQMRSFRLVIFILTQFVFIRLVVNLWVGQVLEIEQVKIWKIMRNDELALREQISFWKITDYFIDFQINWLLTSFILVAILNGLLIVCALKSKSKNFLLLALALPLVSGYMQYYSLLPLIAIVIFQVISNNPYRRYGLMFGLTILALPTHLSSHLNLAEFSLIIALNGFLYIVLSWNLVMLVKNLSESICALFIVNLVSQTFSDLETYLSFTLVLVYFIQLPYLIKFTKLIINSSNTFKTI